MIYRVNYRSEDLHIKGYLGLPPELPAALSHSMAAEADGLHDVTIMETLACSILNTGTNVSESSIDLVWEGRSSASLPKLPLVIYCRGGIGRVGAVKFKWVEEFAAQGYAVFAPTYRGNEGSQGRDEFGGSDMEDVMTALEWLSKLSWIDHRRIHLLGFSRGAINAAYAAAHSPLVSKIILWSGVSDLADTYEQRIDLRRMMKRVIGGTPARLPEAYRLRSPLYYAERIHCPVLIVHGTVDEQVSLQHSLRMITRLQEVGNAPTSHLYDGLGHHFPPPQHIAAIQRMFDWLKA